MPLFIFTWHFYGRQFRFVLFLLLFLARSFQMANVVCLFVSLVFFLCRIMKYSLDFSHLHFNSAHCRKRSSQRHFCHMDFIYFGYKSIDLFRSQRCLFPVWLHWIDQQFVSLKIHKKAYEDQTKQKEWNEKTANFTALTRKKAMWEVTLKITVWFTRSLIKMNDHKKTDEIMCS